MRKIAVATVGRSDYGLFRPILKLIAADPELALALLVSGGHFAEKFGGTVREIEKEGFPIAERLPLAETGDAAASIGRAMGEATMAFSDALSRQQPDLLLLLGDRFEMHAAAVAALPQRIPVAHIHGGELTFGAIDDALRHSITKLAHLHFPSTEEYATRIRQLGEEAWRITVVGAPGLDNLTEFTPASIEEVAGRHRLPLTQPPLLVTWHPVTLETDQAAAQTAALLEALGAVDFPILFTLPNADTGHGAIIDALRAFAGRRADAFITTNLGTNDYFSAMTWAAAMVGNSSSGIIEAASFRLPVVNIGDRQAGRARARNVIDCAPERDSIAAAIRRAVDPAFRASLAGLRNPYGDGRAASRIVSRLKEVKLGGSLLVKRFADLPS